VADPYLTGKWYCDIFDLDPNSSDHSPLRENHSGQVVLHTKNGIELFFIQSEDKLFLNFNNGGGYNHSILLFQVNNIPEMYERMKTRGNEFSFYDPDGRKVEISNSVTNELPPFLDS
jgi:hypothetical protein